MTGDTAEEAKSDGRLTGRIVGESRAVQIVESVAARARERSASVGHVVRRSAVYRWLTKEPEPTVVVIDLQETYTVGPIIRLVDAGVEFAKPYWEASLAKRLVDSVVGAGERFARTRPGQVVTAILEPPEPDGAESRTVAKSESETPEGETEGDS
jgi:hypothetical protein